MAKRKDASETTFGLVFLLLNLEKIQGRIFFCSIDITLEYSYHNHLVERFRVTI